MARAEDAPSPQSTVEARPIDLVPDPGELPPEPAPPPPKPSGRFLIGAGFSSDENFIASATVAQPDLFRTGSLLALHTRISAKRQLFLMRFADPDLFGSPLGMSFDLYTDRRQLPGFTRTGTGGSLTLAYNVSRTLRTYVGYRLENVEVEERVRAAPRTIEPLPPLGGGLLSAVRTGLVLDTTDRSDAPLRGTVLGSELEVASAAFGSDMRYVKSRAWLQHHQPLGPFTLHVSGSATTIGNISSIAIATEAPRSERLFLTSSSDIRGYSPDSFGPIDALGTPVGGRGKLLGSLELEAPLVRRAGLSVFGFADAGALGGNLDGRWQVGRSVGFGLLWRSPIGALKLSWALPLDGEKRGLVFGFGIGL